MSKEMRPKPLTSQNPAQNAVTIQERRAARLADELRANLKRRKSVIRTKAAKSDDPATEDYNSAGWCPEGKIKTTP